MLRAEGLSKRFGGLTATDSLTLEVRPGELHAVIGPNGAGKTTLFNLIAGAERRSSGQLLLDGLAIDGARPDRIFRLGLARTFQIPRPFPEMTVLENVMLAVPGQIGERFWTNWLRGSAVAAQERALRDRARHWLDFVGLDRLAPDRARTLSGGQRKLLELARVLMADPKIILLDEPGAGVNPALLATIIDKIAEINASGVTFLIIEHNMDLVMRLCRPILVMADGRLLLSGTAEEVRSDPSVVDAYLGGVAA